MTKLANHSVAVPVKGLLYRVPDCLSSCLNWIPQPPPPASEYGSPRTQMGGATIACGGKGGPNSDDWALKRRE